MGSPGPFFARKWLDSGIYENENDFKDATIEQWKKDGWNFIHLNNFIFRYHVKLDVYNLIHFCNDSIWSCYEYQSNRFRCIRCRKIPPKNLCTVFKLLKLKSKL